MFDSRILFILFTSSITIPVLFYHIIALIKTSEQINLQICILAIGFTLYSLFFSVFPELYFTPSILYYGLIFEIITTMILLYGFHYLCSKEKKEQKVLIGLEISGGFSVLFALFILSIGKNSFFSGTERISLAFFLQILITLYLIYLFVRNRKYISFFISFTLIIFSFFTCMAIIGHIIPVLSIFKNQIIHLPIILYTLSLSVIARYIPYTINENYKLLVDNTTEKKPDIAPVAVPPEVKKELPAVKKIIIEEQIEDIDFSKILKNKINIYNELPDTFLKIEKAIKPGVIITAKKSEIESFIHTTLSFIRKCKNSGKTPFITLTANDSVFYMTSGDFIMDPTDRSLNMDKVRLTEIKKSAEVLEGKLTINKSAEKDSLIIRIKFENKIELIENNITSDLNNNKAESIIIATDNKDTYNYIFEMYKDRFNTIQVESHIQLIEKLVNRDKPSIIVTAMNDDNSNEELFYKLEKIKEFSNVPIIIISNKTPKYIDLKNYRLIQPEFILRPIDRMELMEITEKIFSKLNKHKERNIQKIENKIEKTDNDDTTGFSAQFDEKCSFFLMNEREKKIVLFLLKGMEYKDIALKINQNTDVLIKEIDSIFMKTGVSSRIELIDLFIK